MNTVLVLAVICGLTLLGDFCIKLSTSHPGGMLSPIFLIGVGLYALHAIGWFLLMQSHSLTAVAVFYSAATLILLAGLGVLVFKETFGLREAAGVALALASVAVISSR